MKKVIVDFSIPYQQINITEDIEVLGLFVGRGSDEVNAKIDIVHEVPDLTSRVNLKAVVFDQAKFDLEAKMVIERGANGTDSYLKVDALVMNETAKARAVPSLEIKVDEVKGGHGATVGQVDQEQLHYLQARGFSKESAEELIVEAFIKEVQEKLAEIEKETI